MERRTQERLRELANGGWETMDPLTRRCMIVLSEELDSLHESLRAATSDVKKDNADTRRTVIALMTAIIVAVVASGILNVAWR